MKYLIFVLSVSLLFSTSTSGKIKSSKKDLTKTSSKKKATTRKLSRIAKDILATQKSIEEIEKRLDILEEDELTSEKKLEGFQKELVDIENRLEMMSSKLEEEEKNFKLLVIKQLSIHFAMQQSYALTKESIIKYEFDKAYETQHNALVIQKKSEIKKLEKEQKSNLYLRNQTKLNIALIHKKQKRYRLRKHEKEKLYKKLSLEEEQYQKKLDKIEAKQSALRTTLAKLNILRKKEVIKAQKEALKRKQAILEERKRQERIRKEKALAKRKVREAKQALIRAKTQEEIARAKEASLAAEKNRQRVYKQKSIAIKQVNSSYKKPPLYRYRGAKTISPLKNAKVVKKFGTYLDPRYKMKIFNESVTLKAKKHHAKVRTVLNGRVVFAGDTPMLGKVVVVAHSHKIHTVYAGLSQIAPTIKVKSKIRKGYVVGKVYQKLIFEATKNSRHLNPLRLIRI